MANELEVPLYAIMSDGTTYRVMAGTAGGGGGGLDQATADGLYVNVTGNETMTGPLTVEGVRVGVSSGFGANYRSIETSGLPGGGHFLFGVQAGGDKSAYLQSHEGSVVLRPNNNSASQLEVQDSIVVANRPVQLNAAVTADNQAVPRSYVNSRTPQITVGTTAPSSPAVGDLWVDTNP